jgi:hypothetical protein
VPDQNDAIDAIILPLTKRLLLAGGADNWEWYGDAHHEAGYKASNDPVVDAHEWLNALENAGVDNWEFCGESLGLVSEYEDYLYELFDLNNALSYEDWSAEVRHLRQADAIERRRQQLEDAQRAERDRIESDPARHRLLDELNAWFRDHGLEPPEPVEDIMRVVWKRTTFPSAFGKSIAAMEKEGGTVDSMREKYLEQIISSGALDRWLSKYYGAA